MKLLKTIFFAAAMAVSPLIAAEELVILHTNDTHSVIMPNSKGIGGWFRHKAIIDSVRAANKNVIVVDAGDAVQGSVYYNLYHGEVEYKLKEMMGYDYAILGNHDFDYKDSVLVQMLEDSRLKWLSSNYFFKNDVLASKFAPYDIREVEGKRIAFMAINIEPDGLIIDENCKMVGYLDATKTAQQTSQYLKECLRADIVVALTHIGHKESKNSTDDYRLRDNCPYIDIIIGGHSHHEEMPGEEWQMLGEKALYAQAYKYGFKMGQFTIDLDNMKVKHHLYTVDSRYDKYPKDEAMAELLRPYEHGVDSVMHLYISNVRKNMEIEEPELGNFLADFIYYRAQQLSDKKVDFAILNKGSIRQPWIAGKLSEGDVMVAQPFCNFVTVQEVSGDSIASCFAFMSQNGGQCVSKNVDVKMNADNSGYEFVKIDGKRIDPNKTYRLATINYVATGGDKFTMLKAFPIVARSENFVDRDIINYIKENYPKEIKTSSKQRMHY